MYSLILLCNDVILCPAVSQIEPEYDSIEVVGDEFGVVSEYADGCRCLARP